MKASEKITIRYAASDGFAQVRSFYTLRLARAYAADRVGERPELGADYAVSYDGIGTVRVDGASLQDLFPALTVDLGDWAPEPGERVDAVTVYPIGGGRVVQVFDDGSDDYCGEDDLTERMIELRNSEYAEMQTAIDAAHGM